MFELKYSITDEDMKKIGKSSGVKRTVLYLSAAVIGRYAPFKIWIF